MDIASISTIIGVNIALMAFIAGFVLWIFNRIDNEIKIFKNDMDGRLDKVDGRLDKMNDRFESWRKHEIVMHAEQSKRTDQLYQMFIDLLKERKG